MNNEAVDIAHKKKWYHSIIFVITMLFCVGPFGLPLLYGSKEFSKVSKIIITILVLLVTIFATLATIHIIKIVIKYYRSVSECIF
ncbi:hypothetical protein ACFL3D_00635 [Candidatus Omnitrophota bacterium]